MKNTRKLLVSSMIMILSCCLLFAGTTFAWFSDSVTSGNNVITAGNLDVEMYWADGTVDPSAATWKDASTGAIFNYDKWEPGYAVARHIKISNEGTLGFKYKVNIVPTGEVTKLAEVIDVYYADPAIQLVDGSDLNESNKIGTLADVLANIAGNNSTATGTLNGGNSDIITLVLKMNEDAGNEYQGLSIGSSFAIQLLATQLNADAEYVAPVNTAEELKVALTAGGKVELNSDITLDEVPVVPAGAKVKLDLNGKTLNAGLEPSRSVKHRYAFTNYGEMVISNGTINARGIFNYGTIILDGATINAIDGDGGYGVRNYAGAKLIMNSGSINTTLEDDHLVNNGGFDATTLRVDSGATFVMNGGRINNVCDWTYAIDNYGDTTINNGAVISVHSTVGNYGTLTINGGSFTCNGLEGVTAHALVTWNGSVTNIYGGSFDGKDNYNGFNVDTEAGSVVNIYGGEFLPVHSGSLYGEGTINVYGGTFFDNVTSRLAEGHYIVNENGLYVVKQAKITTTDDLQNAVNAGGRISLDYDITLTDVVEIPEGVEVTLDLNGKTITAGNDGYVFENALGSTLTINDNTKSGVINGVVYNEGQGSKMIINGGTFNAIAGDKFVFLNNSGELEINGGTINGGTSYPIYSYNENNKLVINDATVNATFGCVNVYGLGSSVVINGGTFEMTGVKGKTSHIVYLVDGDFTINGGTFKKIGDISMSGTGGGGICAIGGANLTINGGNFAGDYADLYNWGGTNANGRSVKISVNGGNFKFNPTSFINADKYEVTGDQTNGFTVTLK